MATIKPLAVLLCAAALLCTWRGAAAALNCKNQEVQLVLGNQLGGCNSATLAQVWRLAGSRSALLPAQPPCMRGTSLAGHARPDATPPHLPRATSPRGRPARPGTARRGRPLAAPHPPARRRPPRPCEARAPTHPRARARPPTTGRDRGRRRRHRPNQDDPGLGRPDAHRRCWQPVHFRRRRASTPRARAPLMQGAPDAGPSQRGRAAPLRRGARGDERGCRCSALVPCVPISSTHTHA